MKLNIIKHNNAYIALSSVLVIAVLIISISVSATLLSISEGQMSLSDQQHLNARVLAEACVGEALLELAETSSLSSSIALPDGNCQLENISNNSGVWGFELSTSLNDFSSKLAIEASLNEAEKAITLISWKEI
jgi:hypothetical protein